MPIQAMAAALVTLASFVAPSAAFLLSPTRLALDRSLALRRRADAGRPPSTVMMSSRVQLKGAKKQNKFRPRKKAPSDINRTPTWYHPSPQLYYDAPPEYTVLPVDDTMDILNDAKMQELLAALRDPKGSSSALERLAGDSEVESLIGKIESIAEEQDCLESAAVARRLRMALSSKGEADELQPSYRYDVIDQVWEEKQADKLERIAHQKFKQIRTMALDRQQVGGTLDEFRDPSMWERYRILDDLPTIPQAIYEGIDQPDTVPNREAFSIAERPLSADEAMYEALLMSTDPSYERPTRDNIESLFEAPYRRTALIGRIQEMYDEWMQEGAQPPPPRDLSRYEELSQWKMMTKRQRKQVVVSQQNERAKENLKRIQEEIAIKRGEKVEEPELATTLYLKWEMTSQPSMSIGGGAAIGRQKTKLPTKFKEMQTSFKQQERKEEVKEEELTPEVGTTGGDGRDKSFADSMMIVYDDETYTEDAFLNKLTTVVPQIQVGDAKKVWTEMRQVGEAIAWEASTHDTETAAERLRVSEPRIWAEAKPKTITVDNLKDIVTSYR
ncbi:unnamed protein product [Vitrella brassicaformis CCMP3155]|uniref:Uncharacterized protein n=2 Tax=Vitrella brassicaformis TaxID=1169539 RepID=A0A0G4FDG0_VITBC|nr:unnamed protein product [Vitrella brassicaformis CCMP3155]|eukprot:CEM11257.1 unnamed protein product [Vitrella brassicaformis CCMP3155]